MNTEYTVHEVLQTALGGSKITNFSVSLLHIVIDLILKKLSCESETVTVTGCESRCLESLLRQSKISPLPLKAENVQTLSTNMERLERLEQRMKCVDDKLRRHLEMVRKYNSKPDVDDVLHWVRYTQATDDLCCFDSEQNVDCQLIRNSYFIRKLRQLAAVPLAEHVKELANRVETVHVKLQTFTTHAYERYKNIVAIDLCIVEIEILRKAFADNKKTFVTTMREIQKLLDAKLNQLYLPALRLEMKWRHQQLHTVTKQLKRTEGRRELRKASAVDRDTDCLSCGGVHTCVQRPFHVGEKQDSRGLKKRRKPPPFCGCIGTYPNAEHQRALAHHVKMVNAEAEMRSEEHRVACEAGMAGINVLEGTDGTIYRKG